MPAHIPTSPVTHTSTSTPYPVTPLAALPKRSVQFRIDADTAIAITEITTSAAYFQAIGYLMQWAASADRYAHCEIIGEVHDGQPEILATYRPAEGHPITYQIGAVWHATTDGSGHFGFHS